MCLSLKNLRRNHFWIWLHFICTSTGLRLPVTVHNLVASSGFKHLLLGRRRRQHWLMCRSPEQVKVREPPEAGPRSLATCQADTGEGCSDGRRAVWVGAHQSDRETPMMLLTQ